MENMFITKMIQDGPTLEGPCRVVPHSVWEREQSGNFHCVMVHHAMDGTKIGEVRESLPPQTASFAVCSDWEGNSYTVRPFWDGRLVVK